MTKIFTGEIKAPSSKSSSLRALICSCLTTAKDTIIIHNISGCDDVRAGIKLVSKLRDYSFYYKNGDLYFEPRSTEDGLRESLILDVAESGFLARAFVSVGTLFSSELSIVGRGSIMNRNLGIEEFANKVGLTASDSKLPVKIRGKIKAKMFQIKEQKSSQFLSGLLFSLPMLQEDSHLIIEELVSRPYIDLTLSYLLRSGIKTSWLSDKVLLIPGLQQYEIRELTPETDWSSLSYIIALGIMNGDILINNLVDAPSLPDRVILKLVKEIGGECSFINATTLQVKKSEINGFKFDLTSNPDLAPTLVALAIVATNASELTNCYRLRDKESDRLISIINMLSVLGVKYTYSDDTLTIFPSAVSGGVVKSYNDHRIAMTALILNAISKEKISVDNYKCIDKSYPDFLNDLKVLGVEI